MPNALFSLPLAIAIPIYYVYLFLTNFAWMVAFLTIAVLIVQAPKKKRARWWALMPFVAIGSSIAGTLIASMVLAIPAFYFRPDLAPPNSTGRFVFMLSAGILSALFSLTLAKTWNGDRHRREG